VHKTLCDIRLVLPPFAEQNISSCSVAPPGWRYCLSYQRVNWYVLVHTVPVTATASVRNCKPVLCSSFAEEEEHSCWRLRCVREAPGRSA
jgi:hypothetical protein